VRPREQTERDPRAISQSRDRAALRERPERPERPERETRAALILRAERETARADPRAISQSRPEQTREETRDRAALTLSEQSREQREEHQKRAPEEHQSRAPEESTRAESASVTNVTDRTLVWGREKKM